MIYPCHFRIIPRFFMKVNSFFKFVKKCNGSADQTIASVLAPSSLSEMSCSSVVASDESFR